MTDMINPTVKLRKEPPHQVSRFAKTLRTWAEVDIELAPDLVVIDLSGSLNLLNIRYHVQPGRLRRALGMKRNGLQVLHRVNLRFGILHCQEVVVSIPGVDPNIRRNHLIGGEGSDYVRDNF